MFQNGTYFWSNPTACTVIRARGVSMRLDWSVNVAGSRWTHSKLPKNGACSHFGNMLHAYRCAFSTGARLLTSGRSTQTPRDRSGSRFSIVERAAWTGPDDVRAVFGSADFLPGNRVVFDIKGNSYRLVAQLKYGPLFLVFIRFVGTHSEYDRIDAAKV